MDARDPSALSTPIAKRTAEVFLAFLRLGCISFGGPIAHIGYFHREIVARRKWLDDAQFAELVGVTQALPGPSSSQLGFALGRVRAGWLGACAAFVAFTTPSAIAMIAFAYLLPSFVSAPSGRAVLHGLQLAAVAVVAQGVATMARRLTPDVRRAIITFSALLAALAHSTPMTQLAIITAGAALGALVLPPSAESSGTRIYVSHRTDTTVVMFALFVVLLVAAMVIPRATPTPGAIAGSFYSAGALVFGGGHVVLPLLHETLVQPRWLSEQEFVAGYGAAQAIPGPLFTFAGYLGARLNGLEGALLALFAIFLPGLLLVGSIVPLWERLTRRARIANAVTGVNSAVIGILAAALYDPLWISAVHRPLDAAIVISGIALLTLLRTPMLVVITLCVGGAALLATAGANG